MEQTQTNHGIAFRGINSANVRLDNSGNASRAYDVSANTDISAESVNGFSGEVLEKGAVLATFSCYGGEENLSVGFNGVPIAKQISVMEAVQSFMDAAAGYAAAAGLVGNLVGKA